MSRQVRMYRQVFGTRNRQDFKTLLFVGTYNVQLKRSIVPKQQSYDMHAYKRYPRTHVASRNESMLWLV